MILQGKRSVQDGGVDGGILDFQDGGGVKAVRGEDRIGWVDLCWQ